MLSVRTLILYVVPESGIDIPNVMLLFGTTDEEARAASAGTAVEAPTGVTLPLPVY